MDCCQTGKQDRQIQDRKTFLSSIFCAQLTRKQASLRTFIISLLLAAVTLGLYWPVSHYNFLNWDDLTYVSTNDHVRGGLTWGGMAWAFTHSYSSNWHPLAWLSHMVDCQLFGLNPGPHHLVNVGFHIANTLLLFLLLRRLTGSLWRSAFVAALFAWHPLHVESVAWVAERKDVLSTFFCLLTLLAYARYAEQPSQVPSLKSKVGEAAHAPRPTLHVSFWYALSLCLFALGLMSKPMLVTLPCVLLLLDYWPLQRFELSTIHHQLSALRRLLLEKLPFFALSFASCIITVIAQKRGGAVASFQMLAFSARLENAAVAYLQYLAKLFWPAHLCAIYPHPAHLDLWLVAGAIAVLVVLTAAAWHWRTRFPFALMGWLWFLGTLVPVIGIVQVGSQAYADRYTYLPLIGLFIGLVWVLHALLIHTGLQPGGLEPCGPGAVSTASTDGRKPLKRLPSAQSCFTGLKPGVNESQGEGSPRVNAFNASTTPFLALLGLTLLGLLAWRTSAQLPYWKDTASLFGHALELDSNNVQALYGLGSDLVEHNQLEQGKVLLEKAIRLQPSYPEALGTMGNLLDGEGKYTDAIRFYLAALQAQPNHDGVLNNLAWLRAACADPAFRDGPEAVRLATKACELTGYSKPLFIGTLAAAQAEAGDFSAAIATAEHAATLATALRLDDIAARNHELIALYRQGKAAHGGAPGNGLNSR